MFVNWLVGIAAFLAIDVLLGKKITGERIIIAAILIAVTQFFLYMIFGFGSL